MGCPLALYSIISSRGYLQSALGTFGEKLLLELFNSLVSEVHHSTLDTNGPDNNGKNRPSIRVPKPQLNRGLMEAIHSLYNVQF